MGCCDGRRRTAEITSFGFEFVSGWFSSTEIVAGSAKLTETLDIEEWDWNSDFEFRVYF